MARSLITCVNEVNRLLHEISGPRATELLEQCALLRNKLHTDTIDAIFEYGLHEYISEFLEKIYDLGNLVNATYFWPADELKSL